MNKTLPLDRKTYLDREVVNALSKDLGLDAEAVARLHGVTNDHDSGTPFSAVVRLTLVTRYSKRVSL